ALIPAPEGLRERHVEPDDREKGRAHGAPALEATHGPLAHSRPLRQLPLRQSEEFACATDLAAQRPHPLSPGPLGDTKLHVPLIPPPPAGPKPARGITRAARRRQGNRPAITGEGTGHSAVSLRGDRSRLDHLSEFAATRRRPSAQRRQVPDSNRVPPDA